MTRVSTVWIGLGVAAISAAAWLLTRGLGGGSADSATDQTEAVLSPFSPPRAASSEAPSTSSVSIPSTRTGRPASDSSHRQALYASASRADSAELERLIAQAKGLASAEERRDALEILLRRYAESDPDGAVRLAMSADRTTAAHLLAQIARVTPDRAWQQANQVTDPVARRTYQKAVATTWAEQEPGQAFAAVAGMPLGWHRGEVLRDVTAELASRDPLLAIELLGTIEQTSTDSLFEVVATEWAQHDPTSAAQWIEARPRVRQGALAFSIADAYVAQKPAEALAWALRISNSPGRNLWSHMVGQIALYDPEEALRLAQSADNPAQRTRALGAVLQTLARHNPTLAMNHLLRLPAGQMRSNVLSGVVSAVAQTSPAAAIDWLEGIEDARLRFEAAMYLGGSLARLDVDAAAQLLDRVPKEARGNWIAEIAVAYADVDLEKGRQWVRKYQDQGEVALRFVQTIAMRNPQLALDLVDDVVDDKQRDRLLGNVLSMVAQQAPEAAAGWVERIEDETMRQHAASTVARSWGMHDAPAARKWVLSLDSGALRDQAIAQLVVHVPLEDALNLIGQIQSVRQRMSAVSGAAARLGRYDPEAARTLLRRYPLDPQHQRQLDSYLKQEGITD